MGTVDFSRSAFKPGAILGGRFQIVDAIGAGAVGTVLHVIDNQLDRESLAIKVLHRHLVTDELTYRRFQNEVLLTRQLSHPHILRIYDFDRITDDHHFVSMELVDGCSLEDLLESRGRRLPVDLVIRTLFQLGQALEFAHRNKIVHRDLKPANVLLDASGAVKVADFGLAQSLNGGNGLTRTGETLGTPAYMSPEQFLNKQTDERSDIYSFGILAYELLTGELPFAAPSYFTLAEQHLHWPLPPVAQKRADAPDWLTLTIEKCCQKNPDDRFSCISQVLDRIKSKAPDGVLEHAGAVNGLPLRRSRSHRAYRRKMLLTEIITVIGMCLALWGIGIQTNGKSKLLNYVLDVERKHDFTVPGIKLLLGVPEIDGRDRLILHKAISKALENPKRYKYLINQAIKFADVNVPDQHGKTPLMRAIEHKELQIAAELLLTRSLRRNAASNGVPPFHAALATGNMDLMRLLTNHEVDPAVKDGNGDSAIHKALELDEIGSLRALLASKVRFDRFVAVNAKGDTVLHTAVAKRSSTALPLLLAARFPMALRNAEGRTPLMQLAFGPRSGEELTIAAILINGGENLSARDNYGCTAYTLALRAGLTTVAELIERHGGKPKVPDVCLLPES